MTDNQHVINALVTWRIVRFIQLEPGPYDIGGKIRDMLGLEYTQQGFPYAPPDANEIAKAVACPACLSVWVGWAVAYASGVSMPLFAGLAYSAFALLSETIYRR